MTAQKATQEFLRWVKTHRKPNTHKWYREHLDHLLRHHFATNALEPGVDSLLVGHLMGHADVTMVAKIYAKPREAKLRDVLNRLSD